MVPMLCIALHTVLYFWKCRNPVCSRFFICGDSLLIENGEYIYGMFNFKICKVIISNRIWVRGIPLTHISNKQKERIINEFNPMS